MGSLFLSNTKILLCNLYKYKFISKVQLCKINIDRNFVEQNAEHSNFEVKTKEKDSLENESYSNYEEKIKENDSLESQSYFNFEVKTKEKDSLESKSYFNLK